jgi:cytochrome c2
MWIPPAFPYLAAFLWMFLLWIRDAGVRQAPRVASGTVLVVLALGSSACLSVNAPDPEFAASEVVPGGDPRRGVQLLQAYGCHSCHNIPGVPGAWGNVGPPLTKVAVRTYLGGRIVNTPENMIRWITNPKAIDEKTAMPATGISTADARHVVAYLYTLQ